MRLKKQIVLMCLALVAFAGLSLLTSSAFALPPQITVGTDCGGIDGQPLTIPITVDDPEDIAGAAFTLEHASALDITVSSNFFTHLQYNQKNTTTLMVAAVRKDGALASASKNIMTLTVRLKAGAAGGSYDINIKPSEITNEEFGYPRSQRIALLTSDVGSPLINVSDFDAGRTVVSGKASFYSDETDSDQDGYSDLQECVNGTDPETPTEPGLEGYNECLDSRVDKQIVELSGPDDVVVGEEFDLDVIYTDDYQTGGINLTVYYDPEMIQYNQSVETPGEIELSFTGPVTETLSFTARQSLGDVLFRVERSTDILFCNLDKTVTIRPDCVAPVINSFTASPASISSGERVTLSWDVAGDENTSVRIDSVFGVPGVSGLSGSTTVNPTSTTTYTLVAQSSCGRDSKSVTVNVSSDPCSRPVINSFSVSPSSISSGGSATIQWSISGATSASITGLGSVSASRGSRQVSPASTTSYTLTATNSCGSVSRSIQLTVGSSNCDPPVINSFTASPASVSKGGETTLSWDISGDSETSVRIIAGVFGGPQISGLKGSTTVTLSEETTYTLIASNSCGQDSKDLTVTISDGCSKPVIERFYADPNPKPAGENAIIYYSVRNADTILLNGGKFGDGQTQSAYSSTITVSPESDTTYTLTAQNSCGTVSLDITLEVLKDCTPPEIVEFYAVPDTIEKGQETTLYWDVKGDAETGVRIVAGAFGGPPISDLKGSVPVRPDSTTTYTLEAKNSCGQTDTRDVTVTVSQDGENGGDDDPVENRPPERPKVLAPGNGDQDVSMSPILEAGDFVDPDGDDHVSTRWQIAKEHALFDEQYLVYDEISDKYLTSIIVPTDMVLETDEVYHWRVLYFDGQAWSSPSESHSFNTTAQGPVYENGIRRENLIPDDHSVKLSEVFADEKGRPVNTYLIKAFASEVKEDLQIGIQSENGAAIRKCGSLEPSKYAGANGDLPEFPYGLIEMTLDVENPGDEARVCIYFSEPIPEGAVWYKFDPNRGEFYNYQNSTSENVVSFSQDRLSVSLRLKDGGFGDLIDRPDGRVIDPGGLVAENSQDPGDDPPTDGGGGGGGGGCFVRTLIGY
jgi:hypothetical protein